MDRCGDEYKDRVEKIARARLSVIGIDVGIFTSIHVSLEEATANPLGDQSRTYRLEVKVSLPGPDQSFTLDVAVVRVGRVVGAITYAGFGDHNADEEAALGDVFVAKMRAGNGDLGVVPEVTG